MNEGETGPEPRLPSGCPAPLGLGGSALTRLLCREETRPWWQPWWRPRGRLWDGGTPWPNVWEPRTYHVRFCCARASAQRSRAHGEGPRRGSPSASVTVPCLRAHGPTGRTHASSTPVSRGDSVSSEPWNWRLSKLKGLAYASGGFEVRGRRPGVCQRVTRFSSALGEAACALVCTCWGRPRLLGLGPWGSRRTGDWGRDLAVNPALAPDGALYPVTRSVCSWS